MRSSVALRPRFFVAVALLSALVAAAGCERQRSAGPAGSTGELPDQEVSDFALTETDVGTPLWKLHAKYAATYSARNLVTARSIRIDFYDEKGVPTSVLTAREGEINDRSRDMVAKGEVRLVTTDGTRLFTEELRFLNREQKIIVPVTQLVRVQRGDDVLTGYGFESDPQLRHYEFKKQVHATVSNPQDPLRDSEPVAP